MRRDSAQQHLWEYCSLSDVDIVTFSGRSGYIEYTVTDWHDTLARLGMACWEIAGVYSAHHGVALYFKRPFQKGRAIDDAFRKP